MIQRFPLRAQQCCTVFCLLFFLSSASTAAGPEAARGGSDAMAAPGAPTIGTATAGDTQATVTFTPPLNDGGSAITGYTVTANPGGATGTGPVSPITVTSLTNGVTYTFTVTATNADGTGTASAASNSVTPKGPQTITFANPGAQSFGTSPDLSILGGGAASTSGLTVQFSSSTTAVCTITSGGTLTFVAAGTCTINANQPGNSAFLPATQVSRSFTVNPIVPGAPTSVVATAGDTQASVAFASPVDTGGSTITGYTVTASPPDVAPVNGATSPIVVTGLTNGQAYTFTVTADNSAGTGPASTPSSPTTPRNTQTITFNNPGAQNFGTTPTLAATSDSGLTPTFTSSTTGVCTITSGGALTFVAGGSCTINADQAGNASFLPATQVTRSFTVNAVVPGAPTIGVATAGNAQASVAFTPPAFTGGATITGYTVTANPGGATGSGAASPLTVLGLTNGQSYTFTVTAASAAGTGAASAASNAVTPKASQTITFANPGEQTLGAALTVTATASSGLAPTFASTTPAVCTTTSGGIVSLTSAGTCSINANQPGSSAFSAAPTVAQSFTVKAQPSDADPGPASVPSAPATPVRLCAVTISRGDTPISGSGGLGTVALNAASGCTWIVAASDAWLVVSPTAGIGPAALSFVAYENTGAASREATIRATSANASELHLRQQGRAGLGAPVDLTAAVDGRTVRLSWILPSGLVAIDHRLDAGSQSGQSDLLQISTGSAATEFTATNVPPGTYFLRIRARTGGGMSAPSNEVVVVVGAGPSGAPEPPAALVPLPVDGTRLGVSWSVSVNATSYIVEFGSLPGLSDLARVVVVGTTFQFDRALEPPGDYYVRVRAANSAGESAPSHELMLADARRGQQPGRPLGLVANYSDGNLRIDWQAPGDGGTPAGYRLDVGTLPGAANVLQTTTPSTSFAQAAPSGVRYYVRVSAFNAAGLGPASDELAVTTGDSSTELPGAPANLTAVLSNARLTLQWATPANGGAVATYVIEAGTAAGLTNVATFDTGSNQPSWSYDGVPPGQTFFLRVRARNAAGIGPASADVRVP